MNSQFCKIGKRKPNFDRVNIEVLETQYRNYVEEAYNLRQTDASLSDVLYYEASQLNKRINRLKVLITKPLDVAF